MMFADLVQQTRIRAYDEDQPRDDDGKFGEGGGGGDSNGGGGSSGGKDGGRDEEITKEDRRDIKRLKGAKVEDGELVYEGRDAPRETREALANDAKTHAANKAANTAERVKRVIDAKRRLAVVKEKEAAAKVAAEEASKATDAADEKLNEAFSREEEVLEDPASTKEEKAAAENAAKVATRDLRKAERVAERAENAEEIAAVRAENAAEKLRDEQKLYERDKAEQQEANDWQDLFAADLIENDEERDAVLEKHAAEAEANAADAEETFTKRDEDDEKAKAEVDRLKGELEKAEADLGLREDERLEHSKAQWKAYRPDDTQEVRDKNNREIDEKFPVTAALIKKTEELPPLIKVANRERTKTMQAAEAAKAARDRYEDRVLFWEQARDGAFTSYFAYPTDRNGDGLTDEDGEPYR